MVIEIPNSDLIYNRPSGLIITRFNTDLMQHKIETVDRLINIPVNANIIEDKSPPISKDELLYISDSLNDLDNGNYYFSRFGQTVEEFIKELQSD